MGQKIEENKELKEKKLLDSAFKLFSKKGFKDTSIQNIVDDAGVAKGTFYLYFKDKYELQDALIVNISQKLFSDALKNINKKNITDFYDRIIGIMDYIIDEFVKNKQLLTIISKDLSWGLFGDKLSNVMRQSSEIIDMFKKGIKENNIKIDNPEVTLFMIVELSSSVVCSSITLNRPLPIEEVKPYLYNTIRKML